MNSRDSRIGELTNCATSILNQYTENEKWKQIHADNISLLRLYQGKEIDFLKTGYRWHLNKSLRKYLNQIPFFLLYNYPKKLKSYNDIKKKNKGRSEEDKIQSNIIFAPSPLNELCSYINRWEEQKFLRQKLNYKNTYPLVINHSIQCTDAILYRKVKTYLREFTRKLKDINKFIGEQENVEAYYCLIDDLVTEYKNLILGLHNDVNVIANYVIDCSYTIASINKMFCWKVFGEHMINNIKINTTNKKQTKIIETSYDFDGVKDFLGKKYIMIEEDVA